MHSVHLAESEHWLLLLSSASITLHRVLVLVQNGQQRIYHIIHSSCRNGSTLYGFTGTNMHKHNIIVSTLCIQKISSRSSPLLELRSSTMAYCVLAIAPTLKREL